MSLAHGEGRDETDQFKANSGRFHPESRTMAVRHSWVEDEYNMCVRTEASLRFMVGNPKYDVALGKFAPPE